MALSEDRMVALTWQAKHTAEATINAREAVMRDLEAKGRVFCTTGDADALLDKAIPTVRNVVESVNGPLLHCLRVKAMHTDIGCVEMLCESVPLLWAP